MQRSPGVGVRMGQGEGERGSCYMKTKIYPGSGITIDCNLSLAPKESKDPWLHCITCPRISTFAERCLDSMLSINS